jgi:hypothetical protein
MSWISKGLGIAVLGLTLSAPSMAAQVRARVVVAQPRVVVAPAPRVVVRSYAPYGWYGYGYYGPVWGYPAYPAYVVRPNTGEVKINTDMKDASLYIDGGYVGPVKKFKKVELRPGNHDVELRDGTGGRLYDRRVQVIVGKTVELRAYS